MTKSLTEQLNNGTLKDGLYYIKDNDNILIGLRYSLTMTRIIDDGCPSFEVLSHVPSYDEYQALLSDQLAKTEGEEIIEELKVENKILKEKLDLVLEMFRAIAEDNKTYSSLYNNAFGIINGMEAPKITKT